MEEKLKKDLLDNIKKYTAVMDDIEKFMNRHQKYADFLEAEIIETMDKLGIKDFHNSKLYEREIPISISIKEIKEEFLDDEMLDFLVVKIDSKLTMQNLRLSGMSDDFIIGYIDRLRDFFVETKPTIAIKR